MFAAALAAMFLAFLARPTLSRAPQSISMGDDGALLMTLDEAALMTPAEPSDFSSAELEASLGACLIMTPGHGGVACPR